MGDRALTQDQGQESVSPSYSCKGQLTNALKRKYRATSKVKVTFDSDAPKLDVRHLYVEVVLVEPTTFDRCYNSEQGSKSREAVFLKLGQDVSVRGEKINLRDVFKDNDRGEVPETVAIVGPAGSGKTVAATKKLPLDWADDLFLPGVQLLFVIPVRTVLERHAQVSHGELVATGCSNLEELLRKTHRELRDESMQEVMTFLAKNDDASKVVFIVDGLDEAPIPSNSILYKLITRQVDSISPKYRLLLTARPCPTVQWLREEGIVDRHISLAGFCHESRDKFFEKYGSQLFSASKWLDMNRKLKIFTEQLKGTNVEELLCLPLIATLFMHALPSISASDLSHFQSSTELLQSLLLGLLKQDHARTSEVARATRFSELSGVRLSSLQCLAKYAHDMTVGGEFVFEDTQGDNGESEGPLSTEDRCLHQCFTFSFADFATGRSVTQRQFVHLSVQEILCAYHVASQLESGDVDDFTTMVGNLAESTNYGVQFTQLFIFLAGMVRTEDLKFLFHAIMRQVCSGMKHAKGSEWKIRSMFLMMLYEASQVKQFNEREPFLAEVASSVANFFKGYLRHGLSRSAREVSACVALLRLCQGQFDYLELTVDRHQQQVVDAITQYQSQACYVRVDVFLMFVIMFTGTVAGDSGVDSYRENADLTGLCGMVASSDNLQYLHLHVRTMTDDAMQLLCSALKENRSLKTLLLRKFSSRPNVVLVLQILCHTNITKLYLGGVSESDWLAICHVIADNDNITHFSVNCNKREIGTTIPIAQLTACLQQNKTLQSLSVTCGRWHANETKPVAEEQLLQLLRTIRSHPQLDQVEFASRVLGVDDSTLVSCMKELIKHDDSRSHTSTHDNQASLTPPPMPPLHRQFKLVIESDRLITVAGIRACMEVLASEVDLEQRWHIDITYSHDVSEEISEELQKYEYILRWFTIWYDVRLDIPFSMETVSAPISTTHVSSPAPANETRDQCKTSLEQHKSLVDPWKEELFITHFHQRIIKLDPEVLRNVCRTKLLVSESEERELRAMQSQSPLQHNIALLDRVRVDGARSFQLFIEILAELGYSVLEQQLSKFLDQLLENDGVVDLTCLGIDQVDPWSEEKFTSEFLPWILTIDAAVLRLQSVAQGILVPAMDRLLQTVQAQGQMAHNTRLLDFIKPNGVASFKRFLLVLQNMDDGLTMREMSKLLPAMGPAETERNMATEMDAVETDAVAPEAVATDTEAKDVVAIDMVATD